MTVWRGDWPTLVRQIEACWSKVDDGRTLDDEAVAELLGGVGAGVGGDDGNRPPDMSILSDGRLILRPPEKQDFGAWALMEADESVKANTGSVQDQRESWNQLLCQKHHQPLLHPKSLMQAWPWLLPFRWQQCFSASAE
jgi:hypothetical protein